MRHTALVVAIAILPVVGTTATAPAQTTESAATPVGGIIVEPSAEPLVLAGCTVSARSPEVHDGLVAAQAGFRCEEGAARRNVTIELWQLDGNGFWQPVPETDETFATSPAMGSSPRRGSPRRGLPLGPDEISCRAAPPGMLHRYRTYVAAFGPDGGPHLHAGPVARLPFDCLSGMAAEHAAILGIPPDSRRRDRLPPAEFLQRAPVCPAFMLSPWPVKPRDCPGPGAHRVGTPQP